MSNKVDVQYMILEVRKMAESLGRTPTRMEFERAVTGGHYKLSKLFGGRYTRLLQAAEMAQFQKPPDLLKDSSHDTLSRQYTKLCSKKEQIQGFFRHTLDLGELFRRAGNPEVLKVSAQPDTHVKFMDVPAVNCYIKFIEYWKPDVHLILGDFLDCEGISHWPSESLEPRRLVPEIVQGKRLLERIGAAIPNCSSKVYLFGNHEAWIEQAFTKMPELFDGLAELGIEINLNTLLGLEKLGYDLFPLNHLVQIGKAHFTHGIYTGNGHPKKHIDTFKANIYYGHLHDDYQSNQTSMEGNIEAASLGCLCRLDAKFLKGRPNNWVHTFGNFEFFRDGSYNFYKPKILNGKLAFNGLVFDGNEKT